MKHWYAIKTNIESEVKVKRLVEEEIRKRSMGDSFGEILIPMEQVSEIRRGKKLIQTRKIYAGYVFLEMEVNDNSRLLVLETHGVTGFVGTDSRNPIPLEDHEVARIRNEIVDKQDSPKPKVIFESGEPVKIKEGPFENFEGTVESIDPLKGTMKLSIMIFGRYTPVELEYWQVEKI